MRIVFICSCAELGKDGVGDYSRTLSLSLIQKGLKVLIIAFNDQFVEAYTELDTNENFKIIRIPSKFNSKKKVLHTNEAIAKFKPDWISLQFVPYAFNSKGLPFALLNQLNQIKDNVKWHLMIHEPWLGISVSSPIKHKLYGFFQKFIIRRMISILKPVKISTSNFLYESVLKKAGIDANILPLFSNIPLLPMDDNFKSNVFDQIGIVNGKREEWKLIGVFGNLYPSSLIESTLNKQLENTDNSINLALIGIGSMSDWAKNEFLRLSNIFQSKIKCIHFGILPEKEISSMLQLWDLGIACTPIVNIGKSGAFAAMRLHKLKIIFPDSKLIPEFDLVKHEEFINREPIQFSIDSVADKFIQNLVSTNKNLKFEKLAI